MIRVRRGAAPAFIRKHDFIEARRKFETFHAGGGTRATQSVLTASSALGPYQESAAAHVFELFSGKCAYSEVQTSALLHLHRPEADALDIWGEVSAEHYWWTALWNGNWYNASAWVIGNKRTRFPVVGERAPAPRLGRTGLVLSPSRSLDVGLILDPCQDDPQLHLHFVESGTVEGWRDEGASWLGDDDGQRGPVTIDLLGLDSKELNEARKGAIDHALELVQKGGALPPELLDDRTPHLGAVRQVLAAHFSNERVETLTPELQPLYPELVPILASRPGHYAPTLVAAVGALLGTADGDLKRALAHAAGTGTKHSPRSSNQSEGSVSRVIPRGTWITRVQIRDFQAIEQFDFVFPSTLPTTGSEMSSFPSSGDVSESSRAKLPWWVLLGENGAGKSSVLKAIGLALATDTLDDMVKRCKLKWRDLLRRGAADGEVTVTFSNAERIHLRFDAKGGSFESPTPRLDAFVRGFGATRLLEDRNPDTTADVRLDNLFQPKIPVMDAEKWLLRIPDDGDFNAAATTIARLLDRAEATANPDDPPPPQKLFQRNARMVTVDGDPLRTLSDGYRSVIAMACDLMAGAGKGFSDVRNIPGFVLLDELGSHLHPRWKMRITTALRDEFPSMQFIVTTHDPLCLRGLTDGEVIGVKHSATLPAGGWRADFERIEQSPSRLRVDQLLTSEFFGLGTTIDPDVEKLFQKYYALVRKEVLTPRDVTDRDELKAQLSRYGVLGYTARDQLIYDAIDEFLADKKMNKPVGRTERRRETVDRVANIWRSIASRHGTGAEP